MSQFELVLENPKLSTYTKVSWMAVALNFFSFIFITYQLKGSVEARWPLTGAALIGIFVMFYFIRKKLRKTGNFRFSFPFFFALFTWIQLHNYFFAAAMLILIVLEEISKKPLAVKFSRDKIIYPSFPQREINWQDLNNVILKDGLLSIDFRNNKLLQANILNGDIDETAFNAFALEQLNRLQPQPLQH